MRARLDELLAAENARITASYMCPHHPDVGGDCDCRKPGLGMYREAIAEYDLDAASSVFIGDRWRDVAAAAALGGIGIMLDVASTPPEDRVLARRQSVRTATTLRDAVDQYLGVLPA